MKRSLLVIFASLFLLGSCGVTSNERRPVPPQGSDSDMPWNRPQAGEGQGGFGGMLQSR